MSVLTPIRWFRKLACASTAMPATVASQTWQRLYSAPTSSRQLLVAGLLGPPNAGKSALANALCGQRVSAVSNKENTTEEARTASFTQRNTQVVLRDLPGVLAREQRGSGAREQAAWGTAAECDALVLVLDAQRQFLERTGVPLRLAEQLAQFAAARCAAPSTRTTSSVMSHPHPPQRPSILLVWNKVDKLAGLAASAAGVSQQPPRLRHQGRTGTQAQGLSATVQGALDVMTRPLQRAVLLERVFQVSALTGAGCAELKAHLVALAQRGQWLLPAHQATDQVPGQLSEEVVRGRVLARLPQDVTPQQVQLQCVYAGEDEQGGMRFRQVLHVPSQEIKAMLLGQGGAFLKHRILQPAEADLSRALGAPATVHLELRVVGGQEKNKRTN